MKLNYTFTKLLILFTGRSTQSILTNKDAVRSISTKDKQYTPEYSKNFNNLVEIFNSFVYINDQTDLSEPLNFLKKIAKENRLNRILDSTYSQIEVFDGIGNAFIFFNKVESNKDTSVLANQSRMVSFQSGLINEAVFQGNQFDQLKKENRHFKIAYKMLTTAFLSELQEMIDDREALNKSYIKLVDTIKLYNETINSIIKVFESGNRRKMSISVDLNICNQCIKSIKMITENIIQFQNLNPTRQFKPTYEYCRTYYTLINTMTLLCNLINRYTTFDDKNKMILSRVWDWLTSKEDETVLIDKVEDTSSLALYSIGLVLFFTPKKTKFEEYLHTREIRNNLINSKKYNRHNLPIPSWFNLSGSVKTPKPSFEARDINKMKRYPVGTKSLSTNPMRQEMKIQISMTKFQSLMTLLCFISNLDEKDIKTLADMNSLEMKKLIDYSIKIQGDIIEKKHPVLIFDTAMKFDEFSDIIKHNNAVIKKTTEYGMILSKLKIFTGVFGILTVFIAMFSYFYTNK